MDSLLNTLPVAAAPVIKDVTTQDFVAEVIKASADVPVLVDFWAPWCEPCKQLAPVLEKVVAAQHGKVKLVKLDIDQNQQLAAQMGIQSIPAVFAFYKGQPVDGFMGVQPESSIRAFVDALLKLSGGKQPALDDVVAKAEEALATGDLETANDLFSAVLDHDPDHAGAYAGFIKIALASGQVDEARAMLDEASPALQNAKEMVTIRAQLDLAAKTPKADTRAIDALQQRLATDANDHQARYDLALALYAQGDAEGAIDQLIESIKRDRTWNEEAAKKQLLTLFEALGLMHEATVAGRRKLSAVLFK